MWSLLLTLKAITVVFRSGFGMAMQYLLKLSCMVRIWRLPLDVVGSLPTVSNDTLSDGSAEVSVITIGSRVLARTNFCSRQLFHILIYSVISSGSAGQIYLSLILLYVFAIPLWPPIKLLWYSAIIFGRSSSGGTSMLP